jgi:hypothetical protein
METSDRPPLALTTALSARAQAQRHFDAALAILRERVAVYDARGRVA